MVYIPKSPTCEKCEPEYVSLYQSNPRILAAFLTEKVYGIPVEKPSLGTILRKTENPLEHNSDGRVIYNRRVYESLLRAITELQCGLEKRCESILRGMFYNEEMIQGMLQWEKEGQHNSFECFL